ncbi:MAG: hypothetical protein AAB613_00670 [Patescibacteria group bacterium]
METRPLIPAPLLEADEIREHVNVLFERVLDKAEKSLGFRPGVTLALDTNLLCLRRRDGKLQFFTCEIGGVGPEGATERSRNWVGYWDLGEESLIELSDGEREWCESAIAQAEKYS